MQTERERSAVPSSGRLYFDYNATTPVDPAVFEAMLPYFVEHFGNPSSGQHAWGWTAEAATTRARAAVAALVGARPHEIFFTSGATEGNNTALFGVVNRIRAEDPEAPIHILVSAAEHSSVLNAARALARLGAEVDIVRVDSFGRVDPAVVAKTLKPHTRLMSFIWANNEIGTLNPMKELAALARERKVYLHTDATQAVGKLPVDLRETPVDLLTFSAHKIYGPKGVGALYVRASDPAVSLCPLLHGGGQEQGLRAGTLNVPGIVGLGKAAELAAAGMAEETARTTSLRDRLIDGVRARIPEARLNGHPTERSPINVSLTFPGRPVELRLAKLQRLGFSTGSACSAGRVSMSHVLAAIGLGESDAGCTVRLSVGRATTAADVDQAIEILAAAFGS